MRHRERCYKVAECILHHVCITRKVGRRLQNVYIITCASLEKLLFGCGVYISSRVHHKESSYKVGECIYQHLCITWKVVIKLQNIYHHVCITGRVVYSWEMYIS